MNSLLRHRMIATFWNYRIAGVIVFFFWNFDENKTHARNH